MSLNDTNYVSNYQNYLSSKDSDTFKDSRRTSFEGTKTKTTTRRTDPQNCNLCRLISKREDAYRILNQGLYNKYTSSLDYYYTKDINAIINKKRKPFTVRFRDEQVYDDDREYLKKFFRRKEAGVHMVDVKGFYTKFKDYPKFFDVEFYVIMGSMVRRHRRLEYFEVFKAKKKEERDPILPMEDQFEFVDMLGESFKRDLQSRAENTKKIHMQRSMQQTPRGQTPRDQQTPREQTSVMEMRKCFNELGEFKDFAVTDHKFSSDYFHYHTTMQNYYELFSKTDSFSAMNDLVSLMDDLATDKPQYKPKLKAEMNIQKSYTVSSVHTGEPKSIDVKNPPFIANLGDYSKDSTAITKSKTTVTTNAYEGRPISFKPSQQSQQPKPETSPKHFYNFSGGGNTPGAKDRPMGPAPVSYPISNRHSQQPSINERAFIASDGRSAKQTYRNSSSLEKFEATQRDTHRIDSYQQIVSSNNLRYQSQYNSNAPSARIIQTNTHTTNNTRREVSNSGSGTHKKLLIDVKELNVDKQNLYKTINDRFKTTSSVSAGLNSSKHIRLPSSGGKFFAPITEVSNNTSGRDNGKNNMSSGNRYIMSKRSGGGKMNIYEFNSVLMGTSTSGSSPIITGKHRRNTSQGTIDKQAFFNTSKSILDKPDMLEELERGNLRQKKTEPDEGKRNSKVYSSSKKLLEKVFGSESKQQLIATLIKSPQKKSRQVRLINAKSREHGSGHWGDNFQSGTHSPDNDKMTSPQRYRSDSGNSKMDHLISMNATSSNQPYVYSAASMGKIYEERLSKDTPNGGQNRSQSMKKTISSKMVLASPSGKLQPYREPVVSRNINTKKKRNRSTEMEIDYGTGTAGMMAGQIQFSRQKSNEMRYSGVVVVPDRNIQKVIL